MCGAGDYMLRQAAKGQEGASQVHERRALILFVRKPELGKVKTRLAATIGDEAALQAYHLMLAHARQVTLAVEAERHLFFATDPGPADTGWPVPAFQHHVQHPGDLGQRMQAAFDTVFALGHDKAIIIGSDCLDLRPSHLSAAYRALSLHDYVIGPAADGGYYLLGMRRTEPRLFQAKQWSTHTVLPDTLADIQALQRTVHQLPTLSDIDTQADYQAALTRNQAHLRPLLDADLKWP